VRDEGEKAALSQSDGRYAFEGLLPGTYRVREVVPAGWKLTAPELGSYDVTVAAGQNVGDRAFGNRRLEEQARTGVVGVVFNDLDGDGVRESGEPPMAGVKLFIDANGDGAPSEGERLTLSGDGGFYAFTNLPAGTHRVREVPPTGFSVTLPASGFYDVTVAAAQVVERHFGNHRREEPLRGNVRGVVFNDADDDGLRDDGEPGLGGVVVFLDTDKDGVKDEGEKGTLSNADGRYAFEGLEPGAYRVREIVPQGFVRTVPADGFYDVNVTAGGNVNDRNFGNRRVEEPRPGVIVGVVYNDVDADGTRDDGEPGLANVIVYLDANKNGAKDEGEKATLSRSDGRYGFELLAPATYRVREVVPAGWQLTQPEAGFYDVAVTNGQAVDGRNFGNKKVEEPRLASIRGFVFNDLDGDGTRDDGEPGMGGVVLFLDADKDGVKDEGEKAALSQPDGRYAFEGLAAGSYRVREIVPQGFTRTVPADGFYDVTVTAGQSVGERIFGNRRVEEPRLASIRGVVFSDLDADGLRDDGEPGLGGWTLYIDADKDGVKDEGEKWTKSNADGRYTFEGLAVGAYRVREVVVEGFTLTRPRDGFYDVILAAGQAANDRHFGNHRPGSSAGSIRGVVYNDLDADGTRDDGESGLQGVRVYLDANNNGRPDAGERDTLTNVGGAYAFTNLPAGVYRVRQVRPEGFRVTAPAEGVHRVELAAGGMATADFGDTRKALIKGVVFNDANADRVRQSTEAALSGWTVFLDLDRDGTVDEKEPTATTGADGRYSFLVNAGRYRVRQVLKEGFRPTNGVFSDLLVGSGRVLTRNFANTRTVLLAGHVFLDADGDGEQYEDEPGIGGRRVFLDADDDGVLDEGERSTLTDARGNYRFNVLPAGAYVVRLVSRPGFEVTTPDGGAYDLELTGGEVAEGLVFGERRIEDREPG
jgi:protocatechuate 3,4-dioxygenase beta subunit